ncbi:eryA [Symbiodinium sp. CCMP2456]|nr:eryA [Symbiodinium sp. CCMP2456]
MAFRGFLGRILAPTWCRTFATTDGPFLYRFKAKRLKWKKRHYNEVLVMADRRKLLETLQEVIDTPSKDFPKAFWEVLSKRCLKSLHLLEPMELAILARAFDVHEPKLHRKLDVFQPLAAQVRSSTVVPGIAVLALTEILPRRLQGTKEELAEIMRFFARCAADCMWEIPLESAVVLLKGLAASGVRDAALCRRVSQKLQARLRHGWSLRPGLLGRAATAMADQDFRDLELFRCLLNAAARGLEGLAASQEEELRAEAETSARAVLQGVALLRLELPEAQALDKTLREVTKKTLWVPPFGAVALIFAAESILAAKEGTLWCRKNIIDRLREACAGVMSACVCTVVAAQLFGDNPTALRTVVMFWAGFSMILNPKAGFFPPAGALCALYVEKALTNGALPGFEYALFPCSTGVALLLFLTRTTTFLISRPIWALRASRRRRSQAQEHKTVFAEA